MNITRSNLVLAGVLGASAVALGAFGAHGLPSYLEGAGLAEADIASRVETFVTGTRYQLHAAVVVLALGAFPASGVLRASKYLIGFGAVVFSGLLYALALIEGYRWLGAIVPLGGLAMILGWLVVIVEAFVSRAEEDEASSAQGRMQEELIRLEEVITHQQQLVQDLNEAVTMTSGGADETARRLQSLEQTVKRLVEQQQAATDSPDERPPHY